MKNLLEKIDYLIERRGLKSKRQLAIQSGIPYTTLQSFYTKGYDKMKLSTLKALAECLGVSIDYLARDEITDINYGLEQAETVKNEISADERQLLTDYRELNSQGKEYIRQTMHMACQTYKKMPDVPSLEHQA